MTIGSILWGVKDLKGSIAFWQRALDYELAFEPTEDFAIMRAKDGKGVNLSLNLVTSERPRQHHMDLYSL